MSYVHQGRCLDCSSWEDNHRGAVLEALSYTVGRRQNPSLASSEISMICSLPLWRSVSDLGSGHAGMLGSLDEATRSDYVSCSQELLRKALISDLIAVLPQKHLLIYQPVAVSLYPLIGIKPINVAQFLARFAVPFLSHLPSNIKLSVLSTIHNDWRTFQTEPSLVSSLSDCAFVTVTLKDGLTSICCPCNLFDPFLPLLFEVFNSSRPEMFPSDQFRHPSWLVILRDLGMKSSVNASLIMDIAREVERQGMDPTSCQEKAKSAAHLLLSHLRENPQSLATGSLAADLSSLSILPASKGLPGSIECKEVLTSFKNAALIKDAPLVFSAAPLVKPEIIPLSSSSDLRIRSPPPLALVFSHLQNIHATGVESFLNHWPLSGPSIESSFLALFSHLDKEGLSKEQKEVARSLQFVPVANCSHLAKPSQLFFRLPFDFSPLAYEVPSFLLPHSDFLRSLGASDEPPSAPFLLEELQALGAQQTDLSSSECLRIADVLSYLSGLGPHGSKRTTSDLALLQIVKQSRGSGGLVVLTSDRRLVRASSAYFTADTKLINGLENDTFSNHLTLVHPLIPSSVAKWLGCSALEDAVREELEFKESNLEPVDMLGLISCKMVKLWVASSSFIEAAHSILCFYASLVSSMEQKTLRQVSQTLRSAASRILFVTHIATKTVLIKSGKTLIKRSPSFFDCKSTGYIYIALPPPYRDVTWVLSLALSNLLGSPIALPLSHLLQDNEISTEALKSFMLPGRESIRSLFALPGLSLLANDAALIKLTPLRRLADGEIVAVKRDLVMRAEPSSAAALAAEKRQSGRDNESTDLVYARVAANSTPTEREAVCMVPLDVGNHEIISVLNTQIWSFQSRGSKQAIITGLVTADDDPRPGPSSQHLPSSTAPVSRPTPVIDPDSYADALSDLMQSAGFPPDMDRNKMVAKQLEMKKDLADTMKQVQDLQALNLKANQEAEASRALSTCKICFSRVVDVAFSGCGHLVCSSCLPNLRGGACPICRKASSSIRLYR